MFGTAYGYAPKNVILVLIDDLGYGDLGAHGNPVVHTPNLDALRETSVDFTNFAVSPTCAPTRAALMTGKHEFKSSVTHTIRPMRNMDLDSTTIAEVFQRNGFATGLFGKWHLGQSGRYGPWFRGFDETLTVEGDNQRSHFDPVLLRNREPVPFKGYRTDIIFGEAIDFIKRHHEEPFFCYLPTYTPHAPLKVPEKYIEPYKHLDPQTAAYYGMVANVDENLGRLLAEMQQTGLDKNTLLIVITDNGGTFGVDTWNAGMRGRKGSAWRGGTRAISFWRYDEAYDPGECGQMTGHVDVFPTLVDLFGLELEDGLVAQLDGDSLRPLLEDADVELSGARMQVHHRGRWPEPSLWRDHKYTHAVVRWKDYQLVRTQTCDRPDCQLCNKIRRRAAGEGHLGYSKDVENYRMTDGGAWELYDIKADSFQEHDLASEKPEIRDAMAAYYEAWWQGVAPMLARSASRAE
ncbi:arylsulfatase [Coraliomargarita sinensis]|uniref:Arylsulfatase n=2 Tax=Coraliomargarita sinensis TaxID=2174842 RepID=A0A317ZKI7_9BACT|nr:arylsulfatase [Coraliomargarita sinensis]